MFRYRFKITGYYDNLLSGSEELVFYSVDNVSKFKLEKTLSNQEFLKNLKELYNISESKDKIELYNYFNKNDIIIPYHNGCLISHVENIVLELCDIIDRLPTICIIDLNKHNFFIDLSLQDIISIIVLKEKFIGIEENKKVEVV